MSVITLKNGLLFVPLDKNLWIESCRWLKDSVLPVKEANPCSPLPEQDTALRLGLVLHRKLIQSLCQQIPKYLLIFFSLWSLRELN